MNTLANLNRLCKLSMLLVLSSGVGCVTGPDEQTDTDKPVGHAEQALSGYWYWVRQTYGQQPSWDLGTDSDKTCFLSGVGGVLKSEEGAPSSPYAPPIYSGAEASVSRSGGHWWLSTWGWEDIIKVQATAICLPSVANRTTITGWPTFSGAQAVDLGPATPYRVCGLTGVSNWTPYYSDNLWQASTDSVQVWQSQGRWYLGGTGNAAGDAVCVDTADGGYWWWQYGAGSGTGTWNLLQQIDHGASPLGTQCFLSGVGGAFQTNDWSNGVFINYDPGSTWWSLTASPQKTGWVICAQ